MMKLTHRARAILDYMIRRPIDTIPAISIIGEAMRPPMHCTTVDAEMRRLVKLGLITRRTGTVSENRGHAAIRIIASGRVLKTRGCPFDAPATEPEQMVSPG